MTANVYIENALVVTTPRQIIRSDGVPITSMRVVYATGNTNNWLTIIAFHSTALTLSSRVSKGDRISIQGHLKIRDWDNGNISGTSVEVDVMEWEMIKESFKAPKPEIHNCSCELHFQD